MRDYLPLLIIGGVIGVISIVLIIMYAAVKDKKQSMGFERHMKDGDIIEQGDHESLMRKNGFYAELYNSQFDAAN